MNEQNQRLHSDSESSEPRPFTPNNKFIKRKLCQLQNKAYFFQGQINPLITQNQKLKTQLTLLNKSVILSTELLRSLLPIGNSQSKRIKLELANIEEISEMIREDWHSMEDEIQRKNFAIEVLEKKIRSNKEEYEATFYKYRKENERILDEKLNTIKDLVQKKRIAEQIFQKTLEKCQKQFDELNKNFIQKIEWGKKLERQMDLYRRQVGNKYREYEKSIDRLKEEIKENLEKFDANKKNLREIYEKMMSEKLQEQAEGFNIMLKTKDDEKEQLKRFYQEKEEQLHKHLNQKSETIRKLESIENNLQNELRQKENTINECNQKIFILHKQIESNFSEISLLKESNILVENKLKLIESKLSQNQQFYKKQLQERTKKYELFEQQTKKKINKLQKANKGLSESLEQQAEKLRLAEQNLQTAENRFTKKLQDQQLKWSAQKLLLEQKVQELHTSISEQQKLHSQKLSEMENEKNKQLQNLKNNYQNELALWKEDSQSQLDLIRQENQRLLSEEKLKNSLQMEKLTQKLQQKDKQFNSMRENLMNELQQKSSFILGLQTRVRQSQSTMQAMKQAHQFQVDRIQSDSKRRFEEMQRLKQEQKQKLQAQMQKKSAQYESKLKKIQNQMMNQINMLKSSSALDELQSKYLAQMQSLRRSHQQQISCMQEKQKQSQNSLIQEQKRRIQQLIMQYEEDMTKLAKRLQNDIEKLNDQLLIQQSDHQITKMTRQEKIQYLSKKISDMKIITYEKENKILELQLEVQQYKREQERMKEIIEEKVNERKAQLEEQNKQFLQECRVNVQKARVQANKKITQVQRDRLQHTQNMYEKFNQLREFHQQQMLRIQTKYKQLQRLFSQRPSRAEDLSKIKQLIQLKEMMDLEMKSYHKKVEHANEIVRYLNLELQNYKDNYDMFGRGGGEEQIGGFVDSNTMENPVQSIIRLKKMNQQRVQTERVQAYLSNRKHDTASPKYTKQRQQQDSPSINDFQIFTNKQMQESQILTPTDNFSNQSRLINANKKSPQQLGKLKRGNSVDKSGEIILNAENFLKLIRSNTPLYKDFKSNEKKAYRKSRPRRLNTLGMGSGDVYSLNRRGSITQDPQR